MKGISICADDYGLHPDVDLAIVDLGGRHRLGGTSVLVDAQGLRERSSWLDGLDIDVGLHLNLTQVVGDLDNSEVQTSLARLILACYLGSISRPWVQNAVRRQFDRFEDLFGRLPDYVDGHQHVHQLPVVRDVLLDELTRRSGPAVFEGAGSQPLQRPWIRSTQAISGLQHTGLRQWFKAMVIQGLGACSMDRSARAAGFMGNSGFAGIYDFTRPALPYERLMQHWLDGCGSGSVIMAHPSRAVLAGDPVGQARVAEYHVLGGQALTRLLNERDLCIVRLSRSLVSDQDSSRP